MTATYSDPETGEVLGEATALEQRAELIPLEALHAARRQLLITLAPLKALHGHGGIWDDRRKAFVEALRIRALARLTSEGGKTTEKVVEAEAYGDPQYIAFLDQAERDKIEYIVQSNKLTEIEEKIRDREFSLLAYNSEIKLAR